MIGKLDKASYTTVCSKIVSLIWVVSIVSVAIYVGIASQFPGWWVLLIAGGGRLFC